MKILRTRTQPQHQCAEAAPAMRRIFAPDYRLDEYAALLRRLAGLYTWLEETIYTELPPDLFATLGPPARRKRLMRDLAALGGEEPVHGRAREAPSSVAGRLGGLYVVEGAALGGRVIHRRLSSHFHGRANAALSFYAGEGTGVECGRRWRRFGVVVASRLDGRADEIDEAVAGAETIFQAFMATLTE